MADLVYNKCLEELAKADTDLATADIRVMLVKTSYTANKDHLTVDDGSANDPASHELAVSGYARVALTTMAVTRDDTNDVAYLDADDVVTAALSAGETIGGAVVYRHTGTDSTSPLLVFKDLTDTPTAGNAVTIQWAAPPNGVIKLSG